ncbi:MAG: hypothetical protein ACFB22_11450 [Rhodothalassiaceae bacterium]
MSSSKEGSDNQGARDAQLGRGPKKPSDFKTSQERESYNTASDRNKKK